MLEDEVDDRQTTARPEHAERLRQDPNFALRPIALLFAIEMVVSSMTVKLSLGFAPQGATGIELDLALLAASLVLVILGPGRLSVDRDVLRRELI